MLITLKYGERTNLQLNLPAEVDISVYEAPTEIENDVPAATKQALDAPLDFPPLRQAIVPGDHVVLALGPGVPQAAEIVAAVVPTLLDSGVAAEDIAVLRSPEDVDLGQTDPRCGLPESVREAVRLVTHDPTHQDEMGFLAADAQGEPIYLNRLLCDADLVVPIGCLRSEPMSETPNGKSNGKSAVWNDTIYPTFADRSTIEHFSPNGVNMTPGQLAHRHKKIDQVAWLLGVQTTAQVVPGGGDGVLRILAGAPAAVFRDGRELYQSTWRMPVPQRADLVIAGLGGGPTQQNWPNLGRALETALEVVNDGGAIVLCTEIKSPAGPALKLLLDGTDPETIHKRLRKLHSADAHLARLLTAALERVTIYLLSNLEEDLVTSLGFGYVAGPDEIARLTSHHDCCIVLADAQYALPKVADER